MANGFVLGRRNNPTRGGLKWVTVYESGSANALAIEPRAGSPPAPLHTFYLYGDEIKHYMLWKIETNILTTFAAGNLGQMETYIKLNGWNYLFRIQKSSNGPTGNPNAFAYEIEASQEGIVYNRISYAVIDDLL